MPLWPKGSSHPQGTTSLVPWCLPHSCWAFRVLWANVAVPIHRPLAWGLPGRLTGLHLSPSVSPNFHLEPNAAVTRKGKRSLTGPRFWLPGFLGGHPHHTATPLLGKNRDDQGSSGAIFPSLKNRYGPGWRSGFPPFAWSQTEDFWGLWERVTGKQFLAQPQIAYQQGFHREYQWSSDNAWTKLLLRVPQKGHLPGWDRPSGVRAGRPHTPTSSLHELEATASWSP